MDRSNLTIILKTTYLDLFAWSHYFEYRSHLDEFCLLVFKSFAVVVFDSHNVPSLVVWLWGISKNNAPNIVHLPIQRRCYRIWQNPKANTPYVWYAQVSTRYYDIFFDQGGAWVGPNMTA